MRTGMTMECIAIIIVVFIMIFVFRRSGKKEYSRAIAPLLLVPAFHLIGDYLAKYPANLVTFTREQIIVGADVAAALVGCLLIGLFAGGIKSKSHRVSILFLCSAFIILLTLMLTYRAVHP